MRTLGVGSVHLDGNDEIMDILSLTCIEEGIESGNEEEAWHVQHNGNDYKLVDRRRRRLADGDSR